MKSIKRHIKIPATSFFLFGPRGTGKSTLVKSLINERSLYIDLLDPETFRTFSAYPERLISTINAVKPDLVIIDEVQKITPLLDAVHKVIEEKKIRFILTGSGPRKLKRSGADMLGGRAVYSRMHPFTAGELGNDFSFDKALLTGLIPVVESSTDPSATLSAYVDLYLREEIQAEGLVRNLGSFSRFLEVISFSHGSILNVSNIATGCQVSRNIVTGYIDILEDLLLMYSLPVFAKRAKRKTAVHPKIYFFDNGLYRRLRYRGPLDIETEIAGPALEGLVGQHLRAWADNKLQDTNLFYWRSLAGNEVDFIIYGGDTFAAIEVKNTKVTKPSDFSGLTSFGDDYPEAKLLLLNRANLISEYKNILVIPVEMFLRKPEDFISAGSKLQG